MASIWSNPSTLTCVLGSTGSDTAGLSTLVEGTVVGGGGLLTPGQGGIIGLVPASAGGARARMGGGLGTVS